LGKRIVSKNRRSQTLVGNGQGPRVWNKRTNGKSSLRKRRAEVVYEECAWSKITAYCMCSSDTACGSNTKRSKKNRLEKPSSLSTK
jgi:hypothetical protein